MLQQHCYLLDPFTVKDSRAKLHCWKGAIFLFHAARHQKAVGQWVNGFMVNWKVKEKTFCACCMERKDNAASKKTDQREWPPQHREKRGSDCLVKWSQSISSPSRGHGVANEPGDHLSTTHRDKRVWTNHRLNERLNRQTGSNESMKIQEIKKIKKYKKKPLCERIKNEEETKAWRTTKSTWELRDGLAFGKNRCTYLLRKDNSQNHGNKQTNEEEKKQKNQIKW